MHIKGKYNLILVILLSLTVLLNLCGFSRTFCNFYTDHIYGVINAIVGRCTSIFPFALGEIIMYLGAVALILLAVFLLLLPFLFRRRRFTSFLKKYSKGILMTLVIFLFVYTTNWFVPFRADVYQVKGTQRKSFTNEEVFNVYSLIVNRINELAEQVPRDADGRLIFDDSYEKIIRVMQDDSEMFPRLAGYYNKPKKALCSMFLDWMGIGGYNYIYTMEPTYNEFVTPLYFPTLIAHEYAHHKGYYKENEAEFISCIALADGDNPFLQYSAYLEMYDYIVGAYYDCVIDSLGPDFQLSMETVDLFEAVCNQYPTLSKQVINDVNYAYEIAEEKYEENVNPQLEEAFQETSAEIAETGWEIQGEVLKENSYSGLTLMLLQYYTQQN